MPLAFPLAATSGYRFGDGWRARRVGVVHAYNQIRGVAPNGTLLRAHDGLDLEVALGTLVHAPFDGLIVDPAGIWKPWDAARYGRTIVIRSNESASAGYLVLLAHLSRQSVALGQAVRRGQVVGRTGKTGNAQGTVPHLHLELRAPFLLDFYYAGIHRRLDVFDAEPSLQGADPNA